MRKFIMGCLIAVAALTSLTGCYERVEPGNVGIIVNRLGDEKGVEQEVKGVGKYWIGWNEELFTFPTFKQMKTYDAPFNFQLSDGTQIGHQLAISYKVNPAKVATIFQTYRKGVDGITDQDLQQRIADILNRQANRINTDKFIDGGKSDLLDSVLKAVQAEMTPVGIEVLAISWIGKPDYPATVIESINAKVNATQKTLQRNQEVEQRKAEANMARAEAEGAADVMRTKAQGTADAIAIEAKAEAESISVRGKALRENPGIMELEAVNKWSGTLPTTMIPGASVPFVNVK